jgi:hypothetical protein
MTNTITYKRCTGSYCDTGDGYGARMVADDVTMCDRCLLMRFDLSSGGEVYGYEVGIREEDVIRALREASGL